MIIKLYEKYVEFLDNSIKKLYSEICTISSAIKSKMPKPKPRPIKAPKISKEKHNLVSLETPTMNVIVDKPKKNTDYLDEIQNDIRRINKSYDNISTPLTATTMDNQSLISGTISIDDYLKSRYKMPGNSVRSANMILDELAYFEGFEPPDN